jgi:hypothetical protein
MKRALPLSWLIVGLFATSALFYAADYVLNPSLRETMGFYTMLDLAFIPINVLIVGLFINRLIASRERQELLHKMNMVIGAFFSQTGNELIGLLAAFDSHTGEDRQHLAYNTAWTSSDFVRHREAVRGDRHDMHISSSDIVALKQFLMEQRPFLLGLLQNPNLLEHASFSDMLWAVTHLSEELAAREDVEALPGPDRRHIEVDMARAYGRLLGEWLLYARHLQAHYPYLFSFAVRTNPFNPDAEVELQA